MPESEPGQVFLCHATADDLVATRLCARLEELGFDVWMDHRDVGGGAVWSQAIVDAITRSSALVLLVSEASVTSEHILREVELAADHRTPLIAARMDGSELPGSLRYFLGPRQILDGTVSGGVALAVEGALRRVGVVPAGPPADPVATAPATPVPAATAGPPGPPGPVRRSPLPWIVATLAIVVAVVVGLIALPNDDDTDSGVATTTEPGVDTTTTTAADSSGSPPGSALVIDRSPTTTNERTAFSAMVGAIYPGLETLAPGATTCLVDNIFPRLSAGGRTFIQNRPIIAYLPPSEREAVGGVIATCVPNAAAAELAVAEPLAAVDTGPSGQMVGCIAGALAAQLTTSDAIMLGALTRSAEYQESLAGAMTSCTTTDEQWQLITAAIQERVNPSDCVLSDLADRDPVGLLREAYLSLSAETSVSTLRELGAAVRRCGATVNAAGFAMNEDDTVSAVDFAEVADAGFDG